MALRHLKLHAKMIHSDDDRGIVGLSGFAPGSFDSRRELAIEVRDEAVTKRLHDVAQQDWHNSIPLDLTDEGLLADLGDRYAGSTAKLGPRDDHPKPRPLGR